MTGLQKKTFRKLSVGYEQLNKLDIKNESDNTTYQNELQELNKRTIEFVYECDITELPKRDLLRLIFLCSKYRPIDPWKFLLRLAALHENSELMDRCTAEATKRIENDK